jgi:hypothetical protein
VAPVRGGARSYSGVIYLSNVGGSVIVKGSVIGGTPDPKWWVCDARGAIRMDNVKAIVIGGDLIGGSVTGSASLDRSGAIQADDVGSISIGGSIFAGRHDSTGLLSETNGGITTDGLGSLTVKGRIVGNETRRVFISVGGITEATPIPALRSITVGGNVEHAVIEAGTTYSNGSIGAVKVSGDWIASSLAANVTNPDHAYGTATMGPTTPRFRASLRSPSPALSSAHKPATRSPSPPRDRQLQVVRPEPRAHPRHQSRLHRRRS